MIPRYRTMKGYMVPRKAGWDTHGLPVELEVEKKLGLDGKDRSRNTAWSPLLRTARKACGNTRACGKIFPHRRLWADMDNPYVTYDNNYIESEWWALKSIYDRGLLYKGFKIVPYCPPLRDPAFQPRGGAGL